MLPREHYCLRDIVKKHYDDKEMFLHMKGPTAIMYQKQWTVDYFLQVYGQLYFKPCHIFHLFLLNGKKSFNLAFVTSSLVFELNEIKGVTWNN